MKVLHTLNAVTAKIFLRFLAIKKWNRLHLPKGISGCNKNMGLLWGSRQRRKPRRVIAEVRARVERVERKKIRLSRSRNSTPNKTLSTRRWRGGMMASRRHRNISRGMREKKQKKVEETIRAVGPRTDDAKISPRSAVPRWSRTGYPFHSAPAYLRNLTRARADFPDSNFSFVRTASRYLPQTPVAFALLLTDWFSFNTWLQVNERRTRILNCSRFIPWEQNKRFSLSFLVSEHCNSVVSWTLDLSLSVNLSV